MGTEPYKKFQIKQNNNGWLPASTTKPLEHIQNTAEHLVFETSNGFLLQPKSYWR